MAIDLTGILSVNEYYTHHYLNTILEEDIKDIVKKFKEESDEKEERTPWSKLKELSKKYYILNEKMNREKNLQTRYKLQYEFIVNLYQSLGYDINQNVEYIEVKNNISIPVLHEVKKANGAPLLWIIEGIDEYNEEQELLHNSFKEIQYNEEYQYPEEFKGIDFEEIITKYIFSLDESPRFILLSSYNEIIIVDRSKWAEKRILNFKLDDILSRKEESTLQATTVLLHKDTMCPTEGISFLDTLSENSHKHASSVSEDLKYALRESIELLGNDAIRDMRDRQRVGVFNKDLAPQLTIECLRYMYRILFLLYIEARPELGYAPMKSNEYLKGYSIESLRDVADSAKLDSGEAKNGTYIDKTLKQLFKLTYDGFPSIEEAINGQRDLFTQNDEIVNKVFTMEPLKAHIFDPERTQLLNKVQFTNETLIKVIKLMSISRPKGKTRPGRISYAQLGINQLGAVYEALLSYRGFLAEEDLYEVKRAGDKVNELEVGYFVTESQLEEYTEEERVRTEDDKLKMYPKGTFIYRLAGREREKSASYYTPEVLTQCLVKYSLKELLKDKTADEILELTICEPAMGSAAFLNEAVNQMAEKYLELKQKELGITIPHDEYTIEKQKVKMYIADRNVYGVDLNPIAVELAEVSLWLNTIYKGAYVPWFGLQLKNGNSLIGARRQTYSETKLKKGNKPAELWYNFAPNRVKPGQTRPSNNVYHFLLGDNGMVDYNDKVIKQLAETNLKYMKDWKKEFNKPYDKEEISQLLRLSETIDKLWEKHTEFRKSIVKKMQDRLSVFGHEEEGNEFALSTREKDRILREEYYSEGQMNAGAYARLKFAMDYWCSLWFWPIEKAEMLPSREEYLLDLSLILEGDILIVNGETEQLDLFNTETNKQVMMNTFAGDLGEVNLDMLCERIPRLQIVKELATKQKFHHWELEFADVFEDRGGFDLIVGNPPWLKVTWDENTILGDFNPLMIVKKYTAPQRAKLRNELMEDNKTRQSIFEHFEESIGIQNFLNAEQNYPDLRGIQSDLYQCFLPKSWMIACDDGLIGFVHPEGIYTDSKAGKIRRKIYEKLIIHFQFQNAKMLFDIAHRKKFSINIFRNTSTKEFINISNLFTVNTIEDCLNCISNNEPVVGLKNSNGEWNVTGHPERVIKIGKKELSVFADLYDNPGTDYREARLPNLHSQQLISVISKFANSDKKLIDIKDDIHSSVMWDETNDSIKGIIRRETKFTENIMELIVSGPHIGVATPIFKTPRAICKQKADYDIIDTSNIEKIDNYLPRTNYVPNINIEEYIDNIPDTSYGSKYTDYYRLIMRKMLSIDSERTLISGIIPPKVGHIHGIYGIAFKDSMELSYLSALTSSIPYDFIIKITGKTNIQDDLAYKFPIPDDRLKKELIVRGLMLNCMNQYYSKLWEECWSEEYKNTIWGKSDIRLNNMVYSKLLKSWDKEFVLRTDYERRQALIEIDVLTSMVLGITLEELKSIYRIQFPVLQSYEEDTWYDINGKIIFTVNRRLNGVGIDKKKWNEVKDMTEGTVEHTIIDDTMPGGPVEHTIVYEAPFDRCDREKDYEEVWKNFEERFKDK
nr:class I SAM-dependent DNA methyltransferase [uncultured Romboutsia sp.]